MEMDEDQESLHIVWFDPIGDANLARTNFISRLQDIVDNVHFSADEESCLHSIQSMENETILLITSGNAAATFLPRVEQLKQIDSIFIFCFKKGKFQTLKDRFKKIVDLFVDFQRLWDAVREQATFLDQFAENLAILDYYHDSTQDLNEQSARFLWFQLAKDLLLRLSRRPDAKAEMIRFCRHYYQDNPRELTKIQQFEETYEPQSVLNWYTHESFVYKMINKALRSQDIDQLARFAFLISDLSTRLHHEQGNERTVSSLPFTAHRGSQLRRREVDRLTQSVHHLICAPGFWSTSREPGRAISFANKRILTNDLVGVLFEIECTADDQKTEVVYADITDYSAHSCEQEVLFDLGTCFRIDSFCWEGNLCKIKLKAVDDPLSITSSFFQQKLHQFQTGDVEFCLGILFSDLGRYQQAKKFFERTLAVANVEDRVWIELHLGRMEFYQSRLDQAQRHFQRAYRLLINANPPRIQDSAIVLESIATALQSEGRLNEALEKHQQVLDIRQKYLNVDHLDLRRSLINIGRTHYQLRNYQHVLEFYRHALRLHDDHPPSVLPEKAMCLNNIANVQADLGHLSEALTSYREALDIRRQIFPVNHPQIAESLQNIGNVQREQGNYRAARESCQRALDIRVKIFSPNHPLVADCRYNIAAIYLCQGNNEKALDLHQQALKIRQKHYASTHLDIAQSLNAIGSCFHKQRNFSEALKYCQQALQIYRQNPHSKELDCAVSLEFIGVIHKNQGDLNQAQEDLQQALEIRERSLPLNHPDTADTLNNLATVFEAMNRSDEALPLYSRSLAIREQALDSNHPSIALTCRNIAHLYWKKKLFDEARRYYQRCLLIDQNNCHDDEESIIADDHFYIATASEKLKQISKALEHYRQALIIYRQQKPDNDPRRLKIEMTIDQLSH